MALYTEELVRIVNSGRCFALIGSGPSCEAGIPSWTKLSQVVLSEMTTNCIECSTCGKLIENARFDEVFDYAYSKLGADHINELLNSVIKKATAEAMKKQWVVYDYITKWPFACYLTTNYDNLLETALRKHCTAVTPLTNGKADLSNVTAESKDQIVKIHGDFDHPQDLVLTSTQYKSFRESPEREYWRNNIMSILKMVRLVMIGYSARDPNFRDQLERAKEISSPIKPVYMIVPENEFSQKDRDEFYTNYNIRVITYPNADGRHSQLGTLLKLTDPFIASRSSRNIGLEPVDPEKASIATSIYVFSKFRLDGLADGNESLTNVYSAIILELLSRDKSKSFSEGEIDAVLEREAKSLLHPDVLARNGALQKLYNFSFIVRDADGNLRISNGGIEHMERMRRSRDIAKNKFFDDCRGFLNSKSELSEDSKDNIIQELHNGVVTAFEKRGLDIARSLLSNYDIDLSESTDILQALEAHSQSLESFEERAAFCELMLEVLLRPWDSTAEYFNMLTQGYFAYHILGLDPKCSNELLELMKKRTWIIDSSILIKTIALYSDQNSSAATLIEKMSRLGLKLCCTEKIAEEAVEHAKWALTKLKYLNQDDPEVLKSAIGIDGWRQNQFSNGYLNWLRTSSNPSIVKYLITCLGKDFEDDLRSAVYRKIGELGVIIREFNSWPNFEQTQWEERESIAEKIKSMRETRGSYRSDLQCLAEAEIVVLDSLVDLAFLSRTALLNKLTTRAKPLVWLPEGVYRYLSLFCRIDTDDSFFQSVLEGFQNYGFSVVSRTTLKKSIEPLIRPARLSLEEERENLNKVFGKDGGTSIIDGFEELPEEDRPFYPDQVNAFTVRRLRKEKEDAEREAAKLAFMKKLTDKERAEYERLKQRKEEKQRKNKKNKAKNRSKKKKSGGKKNR